MVQPNLVAAAQDGAVGVAAVKFPDGVIVVPCRERYVANNLAAVTSDREYKVIHGFDFLFLVTGVYPLRRLSPHYTPTRTSD
jgi:hypothetical protein